MLLNEIPCQKLCPIIFDFKVIKDALHIILHGKEHIKQTFMLLLNLPFFQSHIVEHLAFIIDVERNDVICQAHLEDKQSANSSISIVKWMNSFKFRMEFCNIIEINLLQL